MSKPKPVAVHSPRSTDSCTGVLQRKCTCGGIPGPTGECASCRRKRQPAGILQTKLRVNQPGDRYEREADRMAEQVMRMPEPGLQRQVEEEEEEEELLQTKPLVQRRVTGGADGYEAPPIVHEVLQSPGRPLDPTTRGFMESRFGHDFSQVRVHTDARAADSARAVDAQAFTLGKDMVFGAGQYAPNTAEGQKLLAHELVHIVQQKEQPGVANSPLQEMTLLQRQTRSSRFQMTAREEPRHRKCPKPPTGIGWQPLPEACTKQGPEAVTGNVFYFCQDSTQLLDGQERLLANMILEARTAQLLEIHGNASTEGPRKDPITYNYNLSCMRASVIAERLRNAGITGNLSLFAHGPTSSYSGDPAFNRNVIVRIEQPEQVPKPESTPTKKPSLAPCCQLEYEIAYWRHLIIAWLLSDSGVGFRDRGGGIFVKPDREWFMIAMMSGGYSRERAEELYGGLDPLVEKPAGPMVRMRIDKVKGASMEISKRINAIYGQGGFEEMEKDLKEKNCDPSHHEICDTHSLRFK